MESFLFFFFFQLPSAAKHDAAVEVDAGWGVINVDGERRLTDCLAARAQYLPRTAELS